MRRINDLRQHLDEVAPVFERRLEESKPWSDWSGSVFFDGERLRAALLVERGKVSSAARTKEPSITIRGADIPIQGIVMGMASAFEEYLQKDVEILPSLNDGARQLLDVLFPKTVFE